MIHSTLALLAVLLGTAQAEPDRATIGLDNLAAQAEQVIVGSVLTTRDALDPDGLWTVATIRVAETLRGTPEMIVDVRVPGGRFQDMEMQVRGAPVLIPGDHVLLFLSGGRVVGFGQGAFVVSDQRAWRTLKDWVFMHPSRLDSRSPSENFYVSLDMGTVRERLKNAD